MKTSSLSSVCLAAVLLLAPAASSAANPDFIWSFTRKKATGGDPRSRVLLNKKGNILWGTTFAVSNTKKTKNPGTVYQLTNIKGAWKELKIYQFPIGAGATYPNGASPSTGLVQDSAGVLYGTTESGGANNDGVVYSLTPPAKGSKTWTQTVLYNFSDSMRDPNGPLLLGQGGVLYGTAYGGNQTNYYGGVFQLAPPAPGRTAWTETNLYTFTGGGDGSNPTAGLFMDSAGALYGTAYQGGASCSLQNFGCGTVFKLTPPSGGGTAWTETTLYQFTGPDGALPSATLVQDSNGVLYGTTNYGGYDVGEGAGVVFSLTPPANGGTAWPESVILVCYTEIFCFSPTDGVTFGPGGALFGVASEGGIFKLTPGSGGAWTASVVNALSQSGNNGYSPASGVVFDAKGNLYGTTENGGTYNGGTVYTLKP